MKYSDKLREYNILLLRQADTIELLQENELEIYAQYLDKRLKSNIGIFEEERYVLRLKQKYEPFRLLSPRELVKLRVYEDMYEELRLTYLPTVILRLLEEQSLNIKEFELKLDLKPGTIANYIQTLEIEPSDLFEIMEELGISSYYFDTI